MEQALCAYVMSKSAVTTLIGSGDNGRLYPVVLPQSYSTTDGPGVTYEILSGDEESLLAPDRSGFVQSRVQISCFASTHAAAMSTARAIKNCGIATLKGTYADVNFRGVLADGIRCYCETPADGSTEWRYIAEFDLMVSYLEG